MLFQENNFSMIVCMILENETNTKTLTVISQSINILTDYEVCLEKV